MFKSADLLCFGGRGIRSSGILAAAKRLALAYSTCDGEYVKPIMKTSIPGPKSKVGSILFTKESIICNVVPKVDNIVEELETNGMAVF